MIEVRFLEIAQKELDDAFEYYEYQQADLGYKFVQEVYRAIGLIKSYPLAWSPSSKNTRRCLLKFYPYGIIYQKRDDLVLIVAVANLHRNPDYWAKRV